jgi:hypothetical protein
MLLAAPRRAWRTRSRRASARIDSGHELEGAREAASLRSNFTLWTAVDSWMALGGARSSPMWAPVA